MAHGGDCYRNRVTLDYSININPLGTPLSVQKSLLDSVAHVGRYPDPEHEVLTLALAEKLDVERERIVCGNGASELILAVIHAFSPKRLLLPVPSFTGYERGAFAAGTEINYFCMNTETLCIDESILDALKESPDMLILCNPNNPTGKYIEHSLLIRILETCRERNIRVLLDESFMELSDDPKENSFISESGSFPELMILRSFTKSFAIPGVRLGYLVCGSSECSAHVNRQLPEWNLSVIAEEAGVSALSDKDHLVKARRVIQEERAWLSSELKALGFSVWDSSANYILFKDKGSSARKDIYKELLDQGTLIRKCDDYKGLNGSYYRIAVLGHEDNKILIGQLKDLLNL